MINNFYKATGVAVLRQSHKLMIFISRLNFVNEYSYH